MVILPVVVVSLTPPSICNTNGHKPAYLMSCYIFVPSFIKPFPPSFPVALQGTWWYRSIRYSGDQILINTTQLFMHFMCKTPNMNMKRELLLLNLSGSKQPFHFTSLRCFQLLNSRMCQSVQSVVKHSVEVTSGQTVNQLSKTYTLPSPPRSRVNHGPYGGFRV